MTKRLLSIREAAEYLAISQDLLYRMAAGKEIPSVRIRGRVLFDIKRLDRLIERDFAVEPEDADWTDRLKLRGKL